MKIDYGSRRANDKVFVVWYKIGHMIVEIFLHMLLYFINLIIFLSGNWFFLHI